MKLVPSRRLVKRDVSYEFMNRQMVWHAFTVSTRNKYEPHVLKLCVGIPTVPPSPHKRPFYSSINHPHSIRH